MARGGKKNAARFTRSGAVIGAAKPAAAKTTPAHRLPAADEDTAARVAATARLAEKIKLLEAGLKRLRGRTASEPRQRPRRPQPTRVGVRRSPRATTTPKATATPRVTTPTPKAHKAATVLSKGGEAGGAGGRCRKTAATTTAEPDRRGADWRAGQRREQRRGVSDQGRRRGQRRRRWDARPGAPARTRRGAIPGRRPRGSTRRHGGGGGGAGAPRNPSCQPGLGGGRTGRPRRARR